MILKMRIGVYVCANIGKKRRGLERDEGKRKICRKFFRYCVIDMAADGGGGVRRHFSVIFVRGGYSYIRVYR